MGYVVLGVKLIRLRNNHHLKRERVSMNCSRCRLVRFCAYICKIDEKIKKAQDGDTDRGSYWKFLSRSTDLTKYLTLVNFVTKAELIN